VIVSRNKSDEVITGRRSRARDVDIIIQASVENGNGPNGIDAQ